MTPSADEPPPADVPPPAETPPPEADPPPPPTPAPAAPQGAQRSRFKDLPVWVQAVTAILGVVLAAVGVSLTVIQMQQRAEPTPTPIVLRPEAFIEQVTIDTDTVKASGRFRNVDLAAELILFIGRADDVANAPWIPVEASVSAQAAAAPGALVDGGWKALRPLTDKRSMVWQAIVVPALQGATEDAFVDIRTNGPASSLVLAASEPFRTGN